MKKYSRNLMLIILLVSTVLYCENKTSISPFNTKSSSYNIQKIDKSEIKIGRSIGNNEASITDEKEILQILAIKKMDSIQSIAKTVRFVDNKIQMLDKNKNILLDGDFEIVSENKDEIILQIDDKKVYVVSKDNKWILKTVYGDYHLTES